MVDRKVMAFALAAVMVVGVIGPNVATMIQTAEGHGYKHNCKVVSFELRMKHSIDNPSKPVKF